jgi:hypothetical protein
MYQDLGTLTLYSEMVTVLTTCFNLLMSFAFCPYRILVFGFIPPVNGGYFLEQHVMVTECVSCEVRTEYSCIIDINSGP